MSQTTLDYISGQIANKDYVTSGDIIVKSILTFNNGYIAKGEAIRSINGFDLMEAQKAADNDAISKLESGVEFVLTKTV